MSLLTHHIKHISQFAAFSQSEAGPPSLPPLFKECHLLVILNPFKGLFCWMPNYIGLILIRMHSMTARADAWILVSWYYIYNLSYTPHFNRSKTLPLISFISSKSSCSIFFLCFSTYELTNARYILNSKNFTHALAAILKEKRLLLNFVFKIY